jgi:hypothetical protein
MTGVHGTNEQITLVDLQSLVSICESVARRMAKAE